MMNQKRRARKKKKKVIKRIFIIVLAIAIIAGLICGGVALVKGRAEYKYDDKKSFEKFVNKEFKELSLSNDLDGTVEPTEKIAYQEIVSQAMRVPRVNSKIMDKHIETTVNDINKTVADFRESKENDENFERGAVVTGYSTYKGSDTDGIVISTESFAQIKGEDLKKTGEKSITFNFTKDNKLPVTANMVFNPGYQEELSKYLENVLNEEYSDQLSSGFNSEAISAQSGNLNKFVMTKDGAKFIFDSGVITEGPDRLEIEVSKKRFTRNF